MTSTILYLHTHPYHPIPKPTLLMPELETRPKPPSVSTLISRSKNWRNASAIGSASLHDLSDRKVTVIICLI